MTLYRAVAAERAWDSRLSDLLVIAAGSMLLIASAKVAVPFYPVPMSMQTLVAIGLGLALGPARGAAAVLLYLAQGAIGLPVFVGTPQLGIGLPYMLGPTGGFLLGFLLAALVAGLLAKRGWDRHPATAMAAALIAGAVIYVPGLLWLGSVIGFDKPILEIGMFPFLAGDVVKAMLAALVFPAAWALLSRKAGN